MNYELYDCMIEVTYLKKQKLINYLLNNIIDLITIVGAVIACILNYAFFKIPENMECVTLLLTAIASLLSLTAIANIADREKKLSKLDSLDTMKDDLNSVLTNHIYKNADKFFLNNSIEENFFINSKSVFISGILLRRTIPQFKDMLLNKLRCDADIKIVIIDPNRKELLKILSKRSMGNRDWRDWKNYIDLVIKELEDIVNQTGKEIEIGYLPYIPSFGMYFSNYGEKNAKCGIEIYQHKSDKINPTFILEPEKDLRWFSFFVEQYDILWDSCRKEKITCMVTDESD